MPSPLVGFVDLEQVGARSGLSMSSIENTAILNWPSCNEPLSSSDSPGQRRSGILWVSPVSVICFPITSGSGSSWYCFTSKLRHP